MTTRGPDQTVDDSHIDIERVRADTPAADDVIHLNNAGASLPPTPVTEATIDYLLLEATLGGYEAAEAEAEALDRFYVEAARLLGCAEHEIAFQQNATQAWWAAFNSVPFAPGDRILASSVEYVANGLGLLRARELGVEVELIPDDDHGQTSVDALADMLDERVRLVCITHVPTSGGLINPAIDIGDTIKANSDARYLLDACQSAGQLRLDVGEIGCDFLSLTGRKFLRGPRGTGLLFQRDGLEGLRPPSVMDGFRNDWHSPWGYRVAPDARAHELFEYNFGAKIGFAVALGYANDLGLDRIARRVQALAEGLRSQLESIDGVTVRDQGFRRSGIVTFDVEGHEPAAVVTALQGRGINTSATLAAASQFDLADRAPNGLVRASVHYFNTDGELTEAAKAVADLVGGC